MAILVLLLILVIVFAAIRLSIIAGALFATTFIVSTLLCKIWDSKRQAELRHQEQEEQRQRDACTRMTLVCSNTPRPGWMRLASQEEIEQFIVHRLAGDCSRFETLSTLRGIQHALACLTDDAHEIALQYARSSLVQTDDVFFKIPPKPKSYTVKHATYRRKL